MERLGEKSADNLVLGDLPEPGASCSPPPGGLGGSRTSGNTSRRSWPVTSVPPCAAGRHRGGADEVREVGPEVARSLRNWFDTPGKAHSLDRLLREVTLLSHATPKGKGSGKTFLFTGTL